ncbi:zinc containing alcohol dehydrogenase superfamily protein [Baekduia alba]|uniref:NADPH:quinone reductase n=1 Tax=Baekduia alba TaxID=2997333 RepID=UPI00233FE9B2|nr:NADPH:quinone reductase [Baekduia alba]WCB96865.1 zinc containing alcohol dehydrogenase superfamily protein [Baekduia alba]
MKAAFYDAVGGTDVLRLGELPEPQPEPGEVRVRIAASGINPVDIKRRRGRTLHRAGARPVQLFDRTIPHDDGAGTIDAVGEGVDPARVGERVWVRMAQTLGRPFGTAAQWCCVPAAFAVTLPETVALHEGAALGVNAVTAHYAVHCDGPLREDATVVVQGATSGVGRYAVQLAREAGATVIATAGSEGNRELASKLGAHHVFDHQDPDLVAKVRELTGGRGVDVVVEVEFGINWANDAEMLAEDAAISVFGSDRKLEFEFEPYALCAGNHRVHFIGVYWIAQAAAQAAVDDIGRMLAEGRLENLVTERLPLDRIAEAHDRTEKPSATAVKVVLDVD